MRFTYTSVHIQLDGKQIDMFCHSLLRNTLSVIATLASYNGEINVSYCLINSVTIMCSINCMSVSYYRR